MPRTGETESAATGESDEATDRLWRRVLWSLPTGLYVIGSVAAGRRNLMTANLVMQLSMEPRAVGVSVEREAFTHELIAAGGVYSVNILDREDRAIVRKFVKPVEDVPDPEGNPGGPGVAGPGGTTSGCGTLNGFPVHAAVTGAPVLDRAQAFLDCRVVDRLDLGSHTLFAGEVVGAGFLREGEAGEEVPVLRMEDTRMHYGG